MTTPTKTVGSLNRNGGQGMQQATSADIADAGRFGTSVRAVQATGPIETPKDDGPVTVISPTSKGSPKPSRTTGYRASSTGLG